MALQQMVLSNMDVVERVKFADKDFLDLKKIVLKKVFPKCYKMKIKREAFIGCTTDENGKGYIYIAYDMNNKKYMRLIYLEEVMAISQLYFPNGNCLSKASKRAFLQDLAYYLYMNIDSKNSNLDFTYITYSNEVEDKAVYICYD